MKMKNNISELKMTLEHMTKLLVHGTMNSDSMAQAPEQLKQEQANEDMRIGSGVLINIVEYFVYLGLEEQVATRIAIDTMNDMFDLEEE